MLRFSPRRSTVALSQQHLQLHLHPSASPSPRVTPAGPPAGEGRACRRGSTSHLRPPPLAPAGRLLSRNSSYPRGRTSHRAWCGTGQQQGAQPSQAAWACPPPARPLWARAQASSGAEVAQRCVAAAVPSLHISPLPGQAPAGRCRHARTARLAAAAAAAAATCCSPPSPLTACSSALQPLQQRLMLRGCFSCAGAPAQADPEQPAKPATTDRSGANGNGLAQGHAVRRSIASSENNSLKRRASEDPHTPAPAPVDEPARMDYLCSLGVLDTEPERRFDDLTRLCCMIFKVRTRTACRLACCVCTEGRRSGRSPGVGGCKGWTGAPTVRCAPSPLPPLPSTGTPHCPRCMA